MEYSLEVFKQLFSSIRKKDGLLSYMHKNPDAFTPFVKLSLMSTPEAWRASWLVGHIMLKNDKRIQSSVPTMIDSLLLLNQGHQRQTLIILLNMFLDDNQQGKLFDHCLTIWENIKIIPSTRITAMKFILKTVDKFPDLKPEIKLWTQDKYLESLSPGIKNSLLKQLKKIE